MEYHSTNWPCQVKKCLRACTKSYPGLCSQFIHSVVSNDSVDRKERLRSDCANAQADLSLCCPNMLEDTLAMSSEKMPLSICKMCRFRSSCTCVKSYPSFCSPFIHSVISNDSVSGKSRPDQSAPKASLLVCIMHAIPSLPVHWIHISNSSNFLPASIIFAWFDAKMGQNVSFRQFYHRY